MALRACLVSCRDLSGNERAVEVTADSLYEAVGKALSILRQNGGVRVEGSGWRRWCVLEGRGDNRTTRSHLTAFHNG